MSKLHLKEVFHKHKEGILYLIFGVLTTALNYFTFYILHTTMGESYDAISNTIAFIAGVIFAYITNKLYVFESKSWEWGIIRHELITFIGARLASFGVEELGITISTYVLHLGQYKIFSLDGILIAKLFLNIIVIMMNYIFSKFVVFNKNKVKRGDGMLWER